LQSFFTFFHCFFRVKKWFKKNKRIVFLLLLHYHHLIRCRRAHAVAVALASTSKCFFCFFLIFLTFSSHFLTSSRSCNGHAPLIIQEGRARAGQKVQPRRVRQSSALNSSKARGKGRKDGKRKCSAKCLSHSQGVCLLAKCLSHYIAALFGVLLIFESYFPLIPTSSRSCNGHAPLLIQEGRAHAAQKVQPRQVRQSSTLNSSKALGRGKIIFCVLNCTIITIFANDS
jgi:hypothetical protein